MWRIETTPPSYFFGTVHVPYNLVWDSIPKNAKQAFNQSQIAVFEVDFSYPSIAVAKIGTYFVYYRVAKQ